MKDEINRILLIALIVLTLGNMGLLIVLASEPKIERIIHEKPDRIVIEDIPIEPIAEISLTSVYEKYKGIPYLYGGTDSLGFDCSGFVGKVYSEVYNVKLPRTTKLLWSYGSKVSERKIGDLVFFSPTETYNHVGIYIGNGRFIHSSSSKGIIKTKLSSAYWKSSYVMTRRVIF